MRSLPSAAARQWQRTEPLTLARSGLPQGTEVIVRDSLQIGRVLVTRVAENIAKRPMALAFCMTSLRRRILRCNTSSRTLYRTLAEEMDMIECVVGP